MHKPPAYMIAIVREGRLMSLIRKSNKKRVLNHRAYWKKVPQTRKQVRRYNRGEFGAIVDKPYLLANRLFAITR